MLLFIHSCRYHGPEGYSCSFRAAFPFVLTARLPCFSKPPIEGLCQPFARTLRARVYLATAAAALTEEKPPGWVLKAGD